MARRPSPRDRVAAAEAVLRAVVQRADRQITLSNRSGRREIRRLIIAIEAAQKLLERRLRAVARLSGGASQTFTEASARAYLAQMDTVLQFFKARLEGDHRARADRAIRRGWNQSRQVMTALEAAFTGISRPLRIEEASVFAGARRGIASSLLDEHVTSVDRYGRKMIRAMEQTMSQGMLTGASQSEVIDALVGMGGPTGVVSMAAVNTPAGVRRIRLEAIPEGLFRRHRYWGARIVRTETARAQNLSAHEAILRSREDFPDMQKKILAMMDDRTYPDSVAVHGQIRDVDKPFRDGAGREYMMPPARPNDREMVVPWRPHWGETPTSRPVSATQVARALSTQNPLNLPAGAPTTLADLRRWVSRMRRS